jgi:allantoin racemase
LKRIALIGATGVDWTADEKKKSFVKLHTPQGYDIGHFTPRHGTHSVESLVDEAYNAPFILEQVVKACKEGYDAIVIDCACDPILDAAREVSNVPVVGPRNASLHLALILGTRFSIITVQGDSLKRCMAVGVRKEGLEPFCASVRYLTLPVLDIAKRPADAQKELLELSRQAVEEDGADVIVLGCTALSHEIDLESIALVESGLSHSKVAYPQPPLRDINEAPSLKGAFDGLLKS